MFRAIQLISAILSLAMMTGCSSSDDSNKFDFQDIIGLWQLIYEDNESGNTDTLLVSIQKDKRLTIYFIPDSYDGESCYWEIPDNVYVHDEKGKYVLHEGLIEDEDDENFSLKFSVSDNGVMSMKVYDFGTYKGKKSDLDESSLTNCNNDADDEDIEVVGTPIASITEIVGVWDVGYTYGGKRDEWYRVIKSSGEMIDYDYAGDEVDDYANCYWKNEAQLSYVENGLVDITDDWGDTERYIISIDSDNNMLFDGYFEGERTTLLESDFMPLCDY